MRIPHVTHNDEADITDLEAFRKSTDEAYKKQEVQVMMLAFLIKASVAAIMATGRSDYPNQINNVLAFPGMFRGALDVRASTINEEMKLAAARAIASVVTDDEIDPEYIIPSPFNRDAAAGRRREVAAAAVASGVARRSHHEREK